MIGRIEEKKFLQSLMKEEESQFISFKSWAKNFQYAHCPIP